MAVSRTTQGRRGLICRLQAAGLARGCRRHEEAVEPYKRALFSELTGTVVELGPGAGANMPYFPPGIRWIGIEPNVHAHSYLREEAERRKIEADVRTGTAERIDLPDSCADAVVSSLVLCSVTDVSTVLGEVQRILRPGGRFVFIEHVAAERGSWTRRIQRLLRPLWRVAGGGCHPDREIAGLIQAAGFTSVEIEAFDVPVPVVRPHVAGVAVSG
jgi:SAM-dependent methyltransferase